MKALLKKDLLMILNNTKSMFLFLFIYIFFGITNNIDVSFILPLLLTMLSISTFSYDDFNNWNAYAVTLPKGKINVVRSKYLITTLIILIATLLSIGVSLISFKLNKGTNLEDTLSANIGCISAMFIMISILFPVIFKYGSEKGRILLYIIAISLTGLGLIGVKYINISSDLIIFFDKYYKIIIPLVLIIFVTISYQISKKIYLNREF